MMNANPLNLAFCLFEYVPYGGMQRNLLAIARACEARGHRVEIFCRLWRGRFPPDLEVRVHAARGMTNHSRSAAFVQRLPALLAHRRYDAVVGFNKMPGLDVYYAADPCLAERVRGWRRMLGRYRTYLRFERAVFEPAAETQILLIAEQEKARFMKTYGTPAERFHLLPPGIPRDRCAPPDASEVRRRLRRELGVEPQQLMILMIGSGFRVKGVDRGIRALASLPASIRARAALVIVGEDNARPFLRLARRLGVAAQVCFMGGREDIPRFLLAADLLLHPAYRENTGTVLIEAMASGLPVLTTDVCGYSDHVIRAGAGEVLPSPFRQETLDRTLCRMLDPEAREAWAERAKAYVARTDVFSRAEKAAEIIEQVAG